ncbi:sialic acid-binding Ig-like lectin 15 [Salminus brasiliensis]|uniref:sialic acid-binding Ig-like lectin 15 n=1 Tax=Salminus brasiliensis TaxID=930266 RepID=UPI003B8329DF
MRFTSVLIVTVCLVAVKGRIEMDDPELVIGNMRKNVTIPCSFRVFPNQIIKEATVFWWKSTAFSGPLLYQCTRTTVSSENCSRSVGRYSFAGNLTEQNISLRISNVSFSDAGVYYCRIQLEVIDNWYTSTGIKVQVTVGKELQRIYIQTTKKGARWVTCEVSGDPPPNVTWSQPDTLNTSEILVQTGFFTTSFSVPASPNTNYTCQIDGVDWLDAQSIYNWEHLPAECQEHFYQILLGVLAAVLGTVVLLNIWVLVNLFWRAHQKSSENTDSTENIYKNFPRKLDLDGVYMNARKPQTSK